jgi:opine dehydrogenase
MSNHIWTVIGAGMGGKGIAGQLGVDGFRLRVHDIVDAQVAGIRAAGGLHVQGRDKEFAPVELATTDLAAAVRGASVILVSIYANEHPTLAAQLAPLLEDGQTIVLVPGHFAGALVFRTALERAGCRANVDIAEMENYPYMLDVRSPDTVLMTSVSASWRLATFPAKRAEAVLDKIRVAFPGLLAAPNIFHTSFPELSGIFHVAAIVTNVGRIEGPEDYKFYEANMTPSVVNFMEAMDDERVAIARAYGVDTTSAKTWIEENYGYSDPTLHGRIQRMANTAMKYAPFPKSMSHRFFAQDVPCTVVPTAALAKVAGVSSHASDVAIDLANLLAKRDFRAEGRNIDHLGLAGKGVDEIVAFVSR